MHTLNKLYKLISLNSIFLLTNTCWAANFATDTNLLTISEVSINNISSYSNVQLKLNQDLTFSIKGFEPYTSSPPIINETLNEKEVYPDTYFRGYRGTVLKSNMPDYPVDSTIEFDLEFQEKSHTSWGAYCETICADVTVIKGLSLNDKGELTSTPTSFYFRLNKLSFQMNLEVSSDYAWYRDGEDYLSIRLD